MARIRSVKPDFWADEKIGALSPLARLMFIGSWNLADDEGILRWSPDYLTASLFMYDALTAKKIRALMAEIEEAELVFAYTPTAGGRQPLAYVTNFRKHQKVNRPQPGRFQPPNLTSDRVRLMYATRDGWLCHLCKEPINEVPAGSYLNGIRVEGNDSLNLSMDHVVAKINGGTDQPSNIASAHIGCDKARRDTAIDDFSPPESVRRSFPLSLNDAGTITEHSRQEGRGKGEGEGRGGGTRNTRPDPWCPKHPGGTDRPCGPCGIARRASATWQPPTPMPPHVSELRAAGVIA